MRETSSSCRWREARSPPSANPPAAALGAVVVYVPGNHDDRPEFRRHLLGRQPDRTPINQIHWIDGLRVVLLDSVVIGQEFGELGEETLAFLRDAVAEPAAVATAEEPESGEATADA